MKLKKNQMNKEELNKIHALLLPLLEKRDMIQKEPFKSVNKCCGGGEAEETKEQAIEIEKLKQENVEIVRDFHKISVKLSGVEQEKKEIENEVMNMRDQIQTREEEIKLLKQKNDDLQKDLTSKSDTISVIKQESIAHQIDRTRLEDDLKRLNTENHRISDEYSKLEQELRVTKELYEKLQANPALASTGIRNSAQVNNSTQKEGGNASKSGAVDASSSQLPKESSRQLTGHTSDILCMCYNNNGSLLASASTDKTVKVWDTTSGKIRTSFGGVLQSFTHVAFNPSNELLLGTSNDGTAKIWYLANARLRHSLTGHSGKVTCGDFFDIDKAMTGSHDRTLKLWDINKGYTFKTIVCYSSCNCMMMGGMGNVVVTGHCDNTVRFWDIRSKENIDINRNYHNGSVSDIINILDGRYFATIGKDNIIQYIDGNTKKVIRTFSHSDFSVNSTSRICCSPDGKYIVAGNMNGDVYCWNVENGKLENILQPKLTQSASCYSVAWNPNSSQLVSGEGNKIYVWEI